VQAYPPDQRLWPRRIVNFYLERTRQIRGTEKQLFISFCKPHGHVLTYTIARSVREVLTVAKIEVKQFRGHSTQSVSVSDAKACYVQVQDIIKGLDK
jgi:hypothetical protein